MLCISFQTSILECTFLALCLLLGICSQCISYVPYDFSVDCHVRSPNLGWFVEAKVSGFFCVYISSLSPLNCSISVVIQPVSNNVLEEVNKIPVRGGGRRVGSDPPSSYEEFEMPSGEPSPFSRRRAMFSTGKMVERVSRREREGKCMCVCWGEGGDGEEKELREGKRRRRGRRKKKVEEEKEGGGERGKEEEEEEKGGGRGGRGRKGVEEEKGGGVGEGGGGEGRRR